MIEVCSRSAELSPCGRYRYQLARSLVTGAGTCTFVMLNPSTADHTVDDQTIRRCLSFAHDWGYNRLLVVNLFAWRATMPRAMFTAIDPVGPDGDGWILRAAQQSDRIVCAWGNHGTFQGRGARVRAMLHSFGHTLYHLGLTKEDQPGHPLYVPRDKPAKEWI